MQKIKFILPLFLMLLFGCERPVIDYKYKVVHLSGCVDTIIIHDANPRMSRYDYNELVCQDGSETYAVNVISFSALGSIQRNSDDTGKKQMVEWAFDGSIILLAFIILFILIKKLNFEKLKGKPSIMKSVLKTIIYGGLTIIVFKIILICVKYLPTIIENYFK